MCAMSVILDYGSKIPIEKWTKNTYDDYKLIVERIKNWDTQIGEPDCEDESKGRWMEQVEDRLNKLGKMVPIEVKDEDLPQWLKDYMKKEKTSYIKQSSVPCSG